jgi:hypothetical protein
VCLDEADTTVMALPLRHPMALLVVLGAFAATAAVFTFARPQYHPPNESKMIDFAKVHYYSPSAVRRAFADHGIRLYAGASPGGGMVWFGAGRPPFPADSLQVMVGSRRGKASWGAKLEPYDVRFGNVFVSYGGGDRTLLARVERAVADLR